MKMSSCPLVRASCIVTYSWNQLLALQKSLELRLGRDLQLVRRLFSLLDLVYLLDLSWAQQDSRREPDMSVSWQTSNSHVRV